MNLVYRNSIFYKIVFYTHDIQSLHLMGIFRKKDTNVAP